MAAGWVLAAMLLGSPAAYAQSAELLEKVRLHADDARARAEAELDACDRAKCPDRDRLALLTGYLLLSEGEASGALKILSSHGSPPGLSPWRSWYLGQAAFYTRDYKASVKHFQAAMKGAPPSLEPRLVPRLGEALLAAGEPKKALPLLDRAVVANPSPELIWQRARARLGTKDLEGARGDHLQLAVEHPTHPVGELALEALRDGKGRLPKFTFSDRVRRARAFLDAGKPSKAREELAAIEEQNAQVAFLRAQTAFALGEDDQGEKLLDAAAKGSRSYAAGAAWFRARRALKKSDRDRAHALMLQVVRTFPAEREAIEALYLAAWLDLQEGRYDDAVKLFDQFEKQFARSSKLDEALWFKALAQLRKNDFAAAQTTLQGLASRFSRSKLVPQALYWSARAAQLGGDKAEALGPRYVSIVDRFPGSFYAILAQERLRELGHQAPVPFPHPPGALDAAVPKALEQAVALAKIGLHRDAQAEISAQLSGVRGSQAALEFGHALHRLGEFGPAYALAARYLWGEAFSNKKPEAIALLYPRAFRNAVEREAKAAEVPSHFVWAIMRRESAFRPEVASAADARGLMQIIPPTAKAIAQRMGTAAPPPDALFAPEVNIRFGSWYLAQLYRRFGHPALAAAAYNAGPSAVVKWVKEHGELPLDLFVELIPYKETRGYVKQVLADFHLYQALYAEAGSPGPMLKLPEPRAEGVDF